LVVDTGTGTRLILIPDAGVYLSIGRFGGWGGGVVGGRDGEGEWWEVFDANRMEMEDISHQIIDFYERD